MNRMMHIIAAGIALSAAHAAQAAIEYGTQTIENVTNNTETAVTVTANTTLSLSGTCSFTNATLTIGAGATIQCADGVDSAVIIVKTFTAGANAVVDTGVTLICDNATNPSTAKNFYVNGDIKVTGELYADSKLSYFNGSGTIWAGALRLRNYNNKTLDNALCGEFTFYNKRINITGASMVARHWGCFRFQIAEFGFSGQDVTWSMKREGSESRSRINGQNGVITFDTLDAEDGVTPRTFTWTDNCVKPDSNDIKVVKKNPGSMIVQFNLTDYITGGMTVQGGTLSFPLTSLSLNGPFVVENEGSLLDLSSAIGTVAFNDDLTIDGGSVDIGEAEAVTVAGDFTLRNIALEPDVPFSVGGRLVLGSNTVLTVNPEILTVSKGASVEENATGIGINVVLSNDIEDGVCPIIRGFGAMSSLNSVTVNVDYQGEKDISVSVVSNDLVAVVRPRLTWKGGAGSWTDANWQTTDGETVGWTAGAVAVLPSGSGTITLTEDASAGLLIVQGDWTLAGEGRTLAVSLATVEVSDGGSLDCGVALDVGDAFSKTGAGTLDLTGGFSTVPTTINAGEGTLGLAGANDWSAATVNICESATLGAAAEGASAGIGSVSFASGATIGEGLTIGTMAFPTISGVVNVNGNVVLTNNVSLASGAFVTGTGTMVVSSNMQVAASASVVWGVGNTRFMGGIDLQGTNAKVVFTNSTTVFEAATTASMRSSNKGATFTICEDAEVHINYMHSSQYYYLVVDGELICHSSLSISPGVTVEWIKGSGNVYAGGLVFYHNTTCDVMVPNLYMGELGITVNYYLNKVYARFGNAATTIHPAYSDFSFNGDNYVSFVGSRSDGTVTTINTVDTNDVARTVTFEIVPHGSGDVDVDGGGVFALQPTSSSFTGSLKVKNGATVSMLNSVGIGTGASLIVDQGGTLTATFSVTVANADFAAGAVIKPIPADEESDLPVLTVTGETTFPADGKVSFDLSQAGVKSGWVKLLDWSQSGQPEGFAVNKVKVVNPPNGLAYRFMSTEEGLFVSMTGFIFMVR